MYEIILDKRWGKVWQKTSLKLFAFRTLKILWFNCFRHKKTYMYVLSHPFWYFVLFCSVFYVTFISLSNISSRIILKRKSHGRRNETTLYFRLKTCRKFPQKREHNTSTSLRASSLFWARRENSRESSTRKETRVRGAEWEARSLAPSFAF